MFRVYCDNKSCGKDQAPVLNLETNEVECTECGQNIKSITPFAKSQMKSLGQIKRDSKKEKAFAVQCKYCKKTAPPKIVNDKVVCSLCDKHLDYLATSFVNVIKSNLGKANE